MSVPDIDLDAVESLARSRREYLTRNHLDLILDAVPALTARVRETHATNIEMGRALDEARAEADRLRAQVDAVTALCDEAKVGLAKGCVCSADDWEVPVQHESPECGKPLAWTLDPAAVRAALTTGAESPTPLRITPPEFDYGVST